MEYVIKCAQIYDDNVDKPSHVIAHTKFNTSQGYVNKFEKQKMDTNSKEDVSKKPKGTSGPLLSNKLARVHHERSYFFNALALTRTRIVHLLRATHQIRTRERRRQHTQCNFFL